MFCVYLKDNKTSDVQAEFPVPSAAIDHALKLYSENKTTYDAEKITVEVWECYATTESDKNSTWIVYNKVELLEVFHG